ncbi:MAG: hypothetical protein E7404_06585 [Ruminococcaceae bacterium]|nr:hypothetical protein [Oscillospiraceae bacterium]
MIKILSCIMILISSIALGYLKALDFEKRYSVLVSLKTSIVFIENEMSLIRESVIDIIKKLCSKDLETGLFYKEVLNEKEKNNEMAISDVFKIAADNFYKYMPITNDDKALLYLLGESFGKSDVEGQIKIFNTLKCELDAKIEEAKSLKNKNAKLYKSLGFYMGILIIVMLF